MEYLPKTQGYNVLEKLAIMLYGNPIFNGIKSMSVLFTSATKLGLSGHQSHTSHENNLKLFWFSCKKEFEKSLLYEISSENQFFLLLEDFITGVNLSVN